MGGQRYEEKRIVLILGVVGIVILSSILSIYLLHVWSIQVKINKCLSDAGAIYMFETGQLEIVDEQDGAITYSNKGYTIIIEDGYIRQILDSNLGYTRTFEKGVLQRITIDVPMAEAINLCTPISVFPRVARTIHEMDETQEISDGVSNDGIQYLQKNGYHYEQVAQKYLLIY